MPLLQIIALFLAAQIVYAAATPSSRTLVAVDDSTGAVLMPATASAQLGTLTVSGNASFGADMSVQQTLKADGLVEQGGGITATLGGITASTISAQTATLSTLLYTPAVQTTFATVSYSLSASSATVSNLRAANATLSALTLSPTRWYAVFVLTPPVRYLVNGALIHGSTSIGATSTISRALYKDFVLKGAIQTGSSIRNRVWDVKFVYTSADPGQTVHTQMHAHLPDVYYTRSDYETYDTRAWVKQGATAIGDDGSTRWDLGAWIVVVKETGDWFSPYNQALVWSWIPQDYSGNPPTDPSGRWVWSPVLPDYWTTTPPSF